MRQITQQQEACKSKIELQWIDFCNEFGVWNGTFFMAMATSVVKATPSWKWGYNIFVFLRQEFEVIASTLWHSGEMTDLLFLEKI